MHLLNLMQQCLRLKYVLLSGSKATESDVPILQFAFNTLQRVDPVSHGVCNVVKRIVIIGTSVLFFGNVLTGRTMAGTVIALLGTYLYVEATSRFDSKPKKPETPPTASPSSPAA